MACFGNTLYGPTGACGAGNCGTPYNCGFGYTDYNNYKPAYINAANGDCNSNNFTWNNNAAGYPGYGNCGYNGCSLNGCYGSGYSYDSGYGYAYGYGDGYGSYHNGWRQNCCQPCVPLYGYRKCW